MLGACLFGAAGRLTWWNAWLLVALSFAASVACSWAVRRHPGLTAERHDPSRGEAWDKALVAGTVIIGPMTTWIVAGLEARHAQIVRPFSWPVGAGVLAALGGSALLVSAMRVNAYFSAVARIQRDRGHTVIAHGPYRIVRHPGYAGALVFLLATPLILQSRHAVAPALLTAVLILVRIHLEDRMLHRELAGYRDYAGHVRFRVLPGVW